MDGADLRRIVDSADESGGPRRATRDRALLALACFSGLRPGEILRLRWEDLATELTPAGYWGLTARVVRGHAEVSLYIPPPAAEAVEGWRGTVSVGTGGVLVPVFLVGVKSKKALSYRAARDIVRRACVKAGLPPMESAELRAAFAYWLGSLGLSDHEAAEVLGVARVRTVDRLRRRHAAIDAQRRVREVLDR